jgi:hypothetical protein
MGEPILSNFECPFCGQAGNRTKEHVWAQWLHKTAGAQALLDGTHGERSVRTFHVLQRDEEGRYYGEDEKVGSYAKWLPNFTVPVCGVCNSGWMSALEGGVRILLEPYLFGRSRLHLSPSDLRMLTTWATKSWMAYSLGRAAPTNPFSAAEYRTMAADPKPLDRSCVWLLQSDSPYAQVGMAIETTLVSRTEAPPDRTAPDNSAFAFLAVGSLVMIMLLLPDEAPDELFEGWSPPLTASPTVRRCWPDPVAQDLPAGSVPADDFEAFLAYPPQLFEAVGLPVHEGISDEEFAVFLQDYEDGASPADLRRQAAARDID